MRFDRPGRQYAKQLRRRQDCAAFSSKTARDTAQSMGREIDRFLGRTDDGQHVTIIIEQDVIAVPSRDDPHATIPGLKAAYTDDGQSAERIDDDTWLVPSIGIVRRVQ